jgi:hypothetical protein
VADLDVIAIDTASVSSGLDASIEIVALNGEIDFGLDSQVLSGSGDIELWAANNIKLGGRIATNATVALLAQSGTIGDKFLDGTVVVQAGGLVAEAGLSIGSADNALGIDVSHITADSTRGAVHVNERNQLSVVDGLTWTINRVGADALLLTRVQSSRAAGIISDQTVGINVRNGTLELAAPVRADGDVSFNLTFGAIIDSHGGAIDVRGANLMIVADAVGNSGNALETQVSGLNARTVRGGLYLDNSGTLAVSAIDSSGAVEVASTGTLTVGAVSSPTQVNLESVNGAILGSDAAMADISTPVAHLVAASGIGGTGAAELDLSVDQLVLQNTATGSAYLNLLRATSLASVELAGPGNLYVRAADTVEVPGVVSLYQGSLRAKVLGELLITGELLASGNIDLLAVDTTLTDARLLSNNGDIRLRSSGTLAIDADSTIEAPNGEVLTVATTTQNAATTEAAVRIDQRARQTLATRPSALYSPILRNYSASGTLQTLSHNFVTTPILSVFDLIHDAEKGLGFSPDETF